MIPLVVRSVDWFRSCVCHLYSSETDSTIEERDWTSGSIEVSFARGNKFSAAVNISNGNDRLHCFWVWRIAQPVIVLALKYLGI